MKTKIINAIASSLEPLALITAYDVSGSSPCQSGAMLALFKDGTIIGTVGGGIVEAKAINLAKQCLKKQKSDILAVDMLGENPNDTEMICGGTVKLWIEYISDFSFFKIIAQQIEEGKPVIRVGELNADSKTAAVLDSNQKALLGRFNQKPILINESCFSKNDNIFYHLINPSEKLLILGGGHVGKAIANYAYFLGFEITIADFRSNFADSSLYPQGITCLQGELPEIVKNFNLGKTSYVVIVSPSHLTDLECAKALMTKEYCYAGLMGSRRKVKMIFEELKKEGFDFNKIETLNAPIGLDIGAITPDEIAIAILSEIIAVRRKANNLEAFFKMKLAKRQNV